MTSVQISEEFLTELRDKTDIESLIGSYVELKRRGRLSKGLCPFHSEKTPSFTVYPDTQSYYCFGCGKGGDVITFIRDIENLDYIESVKFLAERAGLNMPDDNYDDSLSKKKRRMLIINKEAARFFHNFMMSPKGKAGLDYWLGRGLTMNTIRHFGLGYAPDDWSTLIRYMKSKGFSESELYEANLAKKSEKGNYYDNFRNRVMTPIIDLRGNIIAFGGRVLDDSKPKYVNTSDTLVYKKSLAVFALNFAKNSGENSLILCEGYMDVISLHQAGFTNAVAGLGTALTDEQVRLISRYCDKVYLSYDNDGAGHEAMEKAISKFENTGLLISPLALQGGKDPDEIIKKFGAERFRSILNGASNEVEYKLLECKKGIDVSSDDGRIKYLRRAVPILAKLQNAIEKDVYAARLSEELGVSKEAIVLQMKDEERRLIRQTKKMDFQGLQKGLGSHTMGSGKNDQGHSIRSVKAEETVIASLLKNPDFLKKVNSVLTSEEFTDDFLRRVYTVLSDRINSGRSADFIFLSSEFSPDEMGKLVKLQNSSGCLSNTYEEISECIKVMKSEKQNADRKSLNPAELSNDEFLKLFDLNSNKE